VLRRTANQLFAITAETHLQTVNCTAYCAQCPWMNSFNFTMKQLHINQKHMDSNKQHQSRSTSQQAKSWAGTPSGN